jgi:putative transposase
MGRRIKALEAVREGAVAFLYDRAADGHRLTAADWEHAMALSGYGRRQLKRLLDERLAGEPSDAGGFQVDDQVITAVFLTTGNIAGAFTMLVEKMGRTDLPCVRHFRRVVTGAMGTLMLAYAQGGARRARDFKVYLSTEKVHRNHTWELDHTELPIWVVPHGHKGAVRPWLTAVVDRGTRYPMSWVVTFGRPSVAEVRACLIQAMTLRTAPDGVTVVGGRPLRTLWDRGLEFLATSITESCMRLDVIPVALPAYSPHLKPHVERLWHFVKTGCLPQLPGYTDAVSDLRGHSAIADACLGEAEFLVALADWFDWYVLRHQHSALGCTPLEAWQRDTAMIEEIPEARLWEDFLVARDKAKVSKNGIRFDTIDFIAPELTGFVGRNVEIRYLPHDRSFIEVFDDGAHVCTAIPKHALTADQQQAVIDHRRTQQAKSRARFTSANRVRRTGHDSTMPIARNKKGQMVVVEAAEAEVDLFAGGDEAFAAIVGIASLDGQASLW